ncbi:MAG: hypothetical protein WCS35_08535 [Sphaerochaeta sp.]
MKKTETQQNTTPSVAVEPAETQLPVDKTQPAVAQNPAKPVEDKAEMEPLPAETPKLVKPLPAPIAPIITKGGLFALPLLEEKQATEPQSSILTHEILPRKAEMGMLPTGNDANAQQGVIEEPLEQANLSINVGEDAQDSERSEGQKIEPADKTLPEQGATPQAAAELTPPTSETINAEDMTTEDKPALEASISVSFLDYYFSPVEKSFNINLDLMSQKEAFGWGGTFEVGKMPSTDILQVSLLAKATWKMGKGDVVTFPLSVSLGPTLLYDLTAKSTEFGMKAKLNAGVTYAISESFRMFYAVGIGATYNFQESSSFRFVIEPIRIGVGFSF